MTSCRNEYLYRRVPDADHDRFASTSKRLSTYFQLFFDMLACVCTCLYERVHDGVDRDDVVVVMS